jgi:hypothetical protein
LGGRKINNYLLVQTTGDIAMAKKIVKKTAKKSSVVLHFTTRADAEGDIITINVKNEKRLTKHGFGLFLEKVKPGELTATEDAFHLINNARYRSGMAPLEIFGQNILGFCAANFYAKDISFHNAGTEWFKKLCKIVGPRSRKKGETVDLRYGM